MWSIEYCQWRRFRGREALTVDARDAEEGKKSFYPWGSGGLAIGNDRGSKRVKYL